MSENFLSIFLTIAFLALIGYQIFRARQNRALRRNNRPKNGENRGGFGKMNYEDDMDTIRVQLEQLKSLIVYSIHT